MNKQEKQARIFYIQRYIMEVHSLCTSQIICGNCAVKEINRLAKEGIRMEESVLGKDFNCNKKDIVSTFLNNYDAAIGKRMLPKDTFIERIKKIFKPNK